MNSFDEYKKWCINKDPIYGVDGESIIGYRDSETGEVKSFCWPQNLVLLYGLDHNKMILSKEGLVSNVRDLLNDKMNDSVF